MLRREGMLCAGTMLRAFSLSSRLMTSMLEVEKPWYTGRAAVTMTALRSFGKVRPAVPTMSA